MSGRRAKLARRMAAHLRAKGKDTHENIKKLVNSGSHKEKGKLRISFEKQIKKDA